MRLAVYAESAMCYVWPPGYGQLCFIRDLQSLRAACSVCLVSHVLCVASRLRLRQPVYNMPIPLCVMYDLYSAMRLLCVTFRLRSAMFYM